MKPIRALPPLAIIGAAVLWSFDGLFRQHLSSVSSLYIVLLEHALGAILFAPFLVMGWQEIRKLDQRSWASVVWVAVFGGLLGTFFYTKALSYVGYIDLSVVVLLQKFQPIFAILLAVVLLRERISKRFLIYAALAILGGYLVTFRSGLPDLSAGDAKLTASLLALCAAFAWGSSTVLGKYALRGLSFFTMTSLRLWVTALVALPIFLTLPSPDIALTSDQMMYLGIIVLSTGSVAVFIYYYGLKHVPASHATLYELFWPLSAVIIDWVAHGRVLTSGQIVGAILLVSVSIILSRGGR
jgi:drug/metabolite transporter (DMT)-like permease